jgi:hypothetical protein
MTTETIQSIDLMDAAPLIKYSRLRGEVPEVCSYPAYGHGELARTEFYDALDRLIPTFIDVLHLDEEVWVEAKVYKVTFKDVNSQTGIGMAIAKLRDDDGLVLTIQLPYLNPDRIDAKLQVILTKIQDEARLYIKGKRAQLSLMDDAA